MATWTSISMEYVRDKGPHVELFPATETGVLRLTARGLWEGKGVYTSPVIDLGEIYTLSGLDWDSIESNLAVINSTPGNPKSLEIRYSDTTGPTLNKRGLAWQDEEMPHPSDPTWGNPGMPWTRVYNGINIEEVDVRYIQWRATFRTLKPSEVRPELALLLLENGTLLLAENGEELLLDG